MTKYTGILALDIDGTLNRRHQRKRDLKSVINWCKKYRKLVVIITARPFKLLFPVSTKIFKGVKIYCNRALFSSKKQKARTKVIQLLHISRKHGVSRENVVFIDNECQNILAALKSGFPRSYYIGLTKKKETITRKLVKQLFE